RHHARTYFGNAGRHVQKGASAWTELSRDVRDGPGVLTALVRARAGLSAYRLEAWDGVGACRPAISPALQYRARAGTLSRHSGRRLTLSDDAGAARFASWCERRRYAGGVEKRERRWRPDRIRRSGSTYPPHLARGNAPQRSDAKNGKIHCDA